MKKKLYYTVEKEIDNTGESLTGNKTITVYEIVNNEPKKFFGVECRNEDNTKMEILVYLDDNGYSDDDFELVIL